MLWFNFFFGLNFISLCSKLITTKQKEIYLKPRIKLNLNIYKKMIRNWSFKRVTLRVSPSVNKKLWPKNNWTNFRKYSVFLFFFFFVSSKMKKFTKKKKRNSSKQTKNVIILNYWHVLLLLLFNIFISRLFSCKVSVNVLQVEMIGLSNAMHRSWIWNVSSLFWCVSFPRIPFPHRYSDGQGSLFRGELIINVIWPRKKIASSFLFGYCKEYLPQRLGRTLDDVRESEAIWLFMSPAAQIMKMKAENTWFFFLFNQRSKQAIKCLKAF